MERRVIAEKSWTADELERLGAFGRKIASLGFDREAKRRAGDEPFDVIATKDAETGDVTLKAVEVDPLTRPLPVQEVPA